MSAADVLAAVVPRTAVVLAAVLLAVALLRRWDPALRHLALAIALLAALLMPALVTLVPRWILLLPVDVPAARALEGALAGVPTELPGAAGSAAPSMWAAGRLLLAVWAVGTVVLLGRIVIGLGRIQRMHRRAVALGRSRIIGHGRTVALTLSGGVEVPMMLGLLRPAILLPESASRWSRQERRAVLVHELAHVRRADAWTRIVAAVACAVYWPIPLVWIAAGWMRGAAEEACDQAVVAAGVSAEVYAGLLVRLSRGRSATASPDLVPGMANSGFSGRVEALLEGRYRRAGPAAAPALGVATTLLVGAIAAVQPVPATHMQAVTHAAMYGIDVALAERIIRAAAAEQIDRSLAFGLVSVESDFDHSRSSRSGAVGLTQILPSSATQIAPGITSGELGDPDVNLRLGFRLLRSYMDRFAGDAEDALLAYSMGPANVDRHHAGVTELRSDYPAAVLRAAVSSAGRF